jgi:hypothetical protein
VSALLDAAAAIDSRLLLLLLLAVLDIWAIGMTLASNGSRREKVLWSAVILLCPIFGCIFWFNLGPKPYLLGSVRSSKRRPAG